MCHICEGTMGDFEHRNILKRKYAQPKHNFIWENEKQILCSLNVFEWTKYELITVVALDKINS